MHVDINPEIVLAALRCRHRQLECDIDDVHEEMETQIVDSNDWWLSRRELQSIIREYRDLAEQINHIEEQL